MGKQLLTIGALALALVPGAASAADSLTFDPSQFTAKTVAYNGKTIAYKAYEGIVYVRKPVDVKYQTINIYVPEGVAADAPVFLPNSVGGYMPGAAATIGSGMNSATLTAALAQGYVVAAPGARGRTLQDASGAYTGKAPAAIVDLKAAVRYLRFNDKLIPGSSEKIVSNGTSAGGALSALLGATGNNADYEPYLKALGAAEARDDIFAVSAYCPITNLDNADAAYEWLFNGYNEVKAQTMQGPPAGGTPPAGGAAPEGAQARPANAPTSPSGTMSAAQIANSAALKALFPAYVNTLGLKAPTGAALTLDTSGNGSFRDYVKSFVVASAQAAAQSGTDLSKLAWVTSKNGKVTDIDWNGYLASVGRMKMTSAFDGTDLSTGENNLFGTASVNNQHFTAFGAKNSTVAATTADAQTVQLMNPMNYIGTAGTTTAKFWRVRHGTADRDTSLAVPALLAAKLTTAGYSVDFALPWAQPHGGDYDLDQLFAWIKQVTK